MKRLLLYMTWLHLTASTVHHTLMWIIWFGLLPHQMFVFKSDVWANDAKTSSIFIHHQDDHIKKLQVTLVFSFHRSVTWILHMIPSSHSFSISEPKWLNSTTFGIPESTINDIHFGTKFLTISKPHYWMQTTGTDAMEMMVCFKLESINPTIIHYMREKYYPPMVP